MLYPTGDVLPGVIATRMIPRGVIAYPPTAKISAAAEIHILAIVGIIRSRIFMTTECVIAENDGNTVIPSGLINKASAVLFKGFLRQAQIERLGGKIKHRTCRRNIPAERMWEWGIRRQFQQFRVVIHFYSPFAQYGRG